MVMPLRFSAQKARNCSPCLLVRKASESLLAIPPSPLAPFNQARMAAKLAAEAFLKRTSGLVQSRTQLLDANQLSKLACTLGSPILPELDVEQLPPSGTRASTI